MKDDLGSRMKNYYEAIPKTQLMRRTPVAIRIDGKAFHTFTRGFKRPFDNILIESMQKTTKKLCENIQGCVFGYTQSDEITLILIDYQNLNTLAWFNYEVEKLCSISASMTTLYFNHIFPIVMHKYVDKAITEKSIDEKYLKALISASYKGAMFDSRCFNIPKEEVANLLYWRQLDATRNSIQMLGQAYFSHKELQNKTQSDIHEMLFTKRGINWNNLAASLKRGTACFRSKGEWIIDTETPIFSQDWNYINQHIEVN